MRHYEEKIDRALDYLQSPGLLNATGDHPVCYVTYDVADAVRIQRMIDTDIRAKAAHVGFDMYLVSLKDIVSDFIKNHDYYETWAMEEDISEEEIFQSISQALQDNDSWTSDIDPISEAILTKQEEVKRMGNPVLVFHDLEWLHPFDRIGRIEALIYKRIQVPMLILYPGESQGNARTFLNIYPMDGNYRSKNF
ncbi:MAG: DUF1788 domain-containing protein [Muribaculaceae bacterium]|nr:DUF1788 domain-containing protein [Muribaculaceae bacterium]